MHVATLHLQRQMSNEKRNKKNKKQQHNVSSVLRLSNYCCVANIGPIHSTEHIALCVASTHHLDLTFWRSFSLQPTSGL